MSAEQLQPLPSSATQPAAILFCLRDRRALTSDLCAFKRFSSEKCLNNLSRPWRRKQSPPVAVEQIDGMIRTILGVRVMLDRDLAKIYGVPTFRFNETTYFAQGMNFGVQWSY